MMNKILSLTLLLCALCMTSCHDMPEIGDLAGQWQIQEINYPDGSELIAPERYYCFYRTVALLTAPGNVMIAANLDYHHPDFSLSFPRDDPRFLKSWGIILTEEEQQNVELPFTVNYHINSLSKSHLEMTTDHGVVIKLKKY